MITGYVNPLSDPDKPSLSTASLLGSPPQLRDSSKYTDAAPASSMEMTVASTTQSSGTVQSSTTTQTQSTTSNSFQSSFLKNILRD